MLGIEYAKCAGAVGHGFANAEWGFPGDGFANGCGEKMGAPAGVRFAKPGTGAVAEWSGGFALGFGDAEYQFGASPVELVLIGAPAQ
jgi:hypothetical protein